MHPLVLLAAGLLAPAPIAAATACVASNCVSDSPHPACPDRGGSTSVLLPPRSAYAYEDCAGQRGVWVNGPAGTRWYEDRTEGRNRTLAAAYAGLLVTTVWVVVTMEDGRCEAWAWAVEQRTVDCGDAALPRQPNPGWGRLLP